jgi:ribosomal protein S21
MPVKVTRREKETVSSLIRRFQKAVQKSGILIRARERMYRDRNLSEEKKKRKALRREELRKYYEKLDKLGLLEK